MFLPDGLRGTDPEPGGKAREQCSDHPRGFEGIAEKMPYNGYRRCNGRPPLRHRPNPRLQMPRPINGHTPANTTWADLKEFAEFNQDFLTWAQGQLKAGKTPGPGGSLGKLMGSNIAWYYRSIALEIAGPDSIAWDDRDPGADSLNRYVLNTFQSGIAGGTDEIQRNIVAERSLGLPREGLEQDRAAARCGAPLQHTFVAGRGLLHRRQHLPQVLVLHYHGHQDNRRRAPRRAGGDRPDRRPDPKALSHLSP